MQNVRKEMTQKDVFFCPRILFIVRFPSLFLRAKQKTKGRQKKKELIGDNEKERDEPAITIRKIEERDRGLANRLSGLPHWEIRAFSRFYFANVEERRERRRERERKEYALGTNRE